MQLLSNSDLTNSLKQFLKDIDTADLGISRGETTRKAVAVSLGLSLDRRLLDENSVGAELTILSLDLEELSHGLSAEPDEEEFLWVEVVRIAERLRRQLELLD